MPTFIEITPDPFAEQFRKETAGDALEQGSAPGSTRIKRRSFAHVRRPVRGIQLKEDTYATMQVRTADGRYIPLIDGGSIEDDIDNPGFGASSKFSNFLLQTVQEDRTEKTQVVQTFGEPFVFFFGEHPRIVRCQGVLINTEDFNWRAEFWENYDRYLRGTKCVQNKTRVTLSWDDIVIEGYFLQAAATESSKEPGYVNFQFQIFLTNYQNVSKLGSTDFPSGSFEGNVSPDQIDIPGFSTLPANSDTAQVRQLNIQSQRPVKNSLFQALRNGISEVATLDGRLEFLFNLTSLLIGRNKRVRVPIGFAGGSVFDVDTQIALASVDPTARNILIRSTLSGQDFFIEGARGIRSQPSFYGKFRDAQDEYIASYPSVLNNPAQPIDLSTEQKINNNELVQKIQDVYRKFGVPFDPPPTAVRLARALVFGVIQSTFTSTPVVPNVVNALALV